MKRQTPPHYSAQMQERAKRQIRITKHWQTVNDINRVFESVQTRLCIVGAAIALFQVCAVVPSGPWSSLSSLLLLVAGLILALAWPLGLGVLIPTLALTLAAAPPLASALDLDSPPPTPSPCPSRPRLPRWLLSLTLTFTLPLLVCSPNSRSPKDPGSLPRTYINKEGQTMFIVHPPAALLDRLARVVGPEMAAAFNSTNNKLRSFKRREAAAGQWEIMANRWVRAVREVHALKLNRTRALGGGADGGGKSGGSRSGGRVGNTNSNPNVRATPNPNPLLCVHFASATPQVMSDPNLNPNPNPNLTLTLTLTAGHGARAAQHAGRAAALPLGHHLLRRPGNGHRRLLGGAFEWGEPQSGGRPEGGPGDVLSAARGVYTGFHSQAANVRMLCYILYIPP